MLFAQYSRFSLAPGDDHRAAGIAEHVDRRAGHIEEAVNGEDGADRVNDDAFPFDDRPHLAGRVDVAQQRRDHCGPGDGEDRTDQRGDAQVVAEHLGHEDGGQSEGKGHSQTES